MRYKALSVKQPWASLIATGEKTIETRTWPTSYRGELLICSSAKPRIAGKPAGVTMCLCRLVACRPMTWRDEQAACCERYAGAYAWVLADIRPVEHVPVKGRLGIFEIEVEVGDSRKGAEAQREE